MKTNNKRSLLLVFLSLVFIVIPVFAAPSIIGGIPFPYVNASTSTPSVLINNSYYLRDTSLTMTGQEIRRDVTNSNLNLFGGTNGAGQGGIVSVQGADLSGDSIVFYVPDTVHSANLIAAKFVGLVNFPYLDMNAHQIKSVKDPTDPQDATTLAYEDARPVINSSYAKLADIPDTSLFLFLNGSRAMTGDFNLNGMNMSSTGYIDLVEITPPAAPTANILRLYAEDFHGYSFFSYVDDTGMVRKIVRDSVFVARASEDIGKGQAVYASGATDNVPNIKRACSNSTTTMPAIGIAVEAISSGSFGRVMQVGLLENINTNAFSIGNLLYVDPIAAGNLNATAPLYPYLKQEMGTVLVKGVGNGQIQVVARSVINDGLTSHSGLSNLTEGDPHSQYAYLPGRSGGQVLTGGTDANDNLILNGTSSATKASSLVVLQPDGGNVSIGTKNHIPGYIVNVDSGSRSNYILFTNDATGRVLGDGFLIGLNSGGWATLKNYENQKLEFGTNNQIRATIMETGKIGIGTDNPDSDLHINTTGTQQLSIESKNNFASLLFKGGNAGATTWIMQSGYPFGGAFNIRQAGVVNALTINKTNGYVGIGTSTTIPTAQLHTTGTVRFANFGAGTATFDAGGNISSVSDGKYKTDIVPFTEGLAAILTVNPKQFHYTAESGLDTANTYIGFVAQDLQKSIPSAVYSKKDVKYEDILLKKGATENEDEYITVEVPLGTNTLSVDDRAIIATLVNAVQEQQVQIDNLTKRVEYLESKVGK